MAKKRKPAAPKPFRMYVGAVVVSDGAEGDSPTHGSVMANHHANGDTITDKDGVVQADVWVWVADGSFDKYPAGYDRGQKTCSFNVDGDATSLARRRCFIFCRWAATRTRPILLRMCTPHGTSRSSTVTCK